MQLAPYLFFNGNCEEALNQYAAIFNGKIVGLNRYGGSPVAEQAPPGYTDKVMHASFEADGVSFMASDGMPGPERGEGPISLCLALKDVTEATRVFNALAEGGKISMPLAKQFWGDTFGTLTDKFGIEWMVNCSS